MASYASVVLADSPLAYWRLGEASGTTAVDLAGSNDGTYVNTPTLGVTGAITGDADTAATFDGADERVTVAATSAWSIATTGTLTVEAWVNVSGSTHGIIAGRGSWSDGWEWELGQTIYEGRTFFTAKTWTPDSASSGRTDFDCGSTLTGWHHVVAVFRQASTIDLYVDGVAAPSPSSAVTTTASTGPLVIANRGEYDDGFNGTLDEVAVYDYALTSTQVAAHYAAGLGKFGPPSVYAATVLADSPVAYWRLGDTGSTLADSSGNGYSMTKSSGFTTGAAGALTGDSDTAISGDGSTGAGTVPSGVNPFGSDFTVEGWALADGTSAYQGVFGGGAYQTNGFRLGRRLSRWAFWTDENGGNIAIEASTSLSTGTWYHVAVVRSGSTFTLYVNGSSIGSSSGTYTAPTGSLYVGTYSGGDWAGDLDEFAVYSTALSSTRIAAHYAAGLGKFGPPSVYAAIVLADAPVAHWRLGEASGTTANAEVGPDGVYENTPTLGVTGLLTGDSDTAVTFARSTSESVQIETGMPAGSTAYSIEMWLDTAAIPAFEQWVLWSRGYSTDTGFHEFGYRRWDDTSCDFFLVFGGEGVYVSAYAGSYATHADGLLGQHHVVAVVDYTAKTFKVYLDGSLSNPEADDLTGLEAYFLVPPADAHSRIAGYSGNNLNMFDGTLDEVAIYDYALTPEQVAAHYAAGLGRVAVWGGL